MNEETPVETPVDTPVETPVDTPVETPVDTPVDTPVEIPYGISESACVSDFEPGVMMSALREMIGTPACGFEYIEYALAGAIFVILFSLVTNVFVGFSKMYGAR